VVSNAKPLERSRWANVRWLVLCPHADDETIGTASLISYANERGILAEVAFLTDGAASHPSIDEHARQGLIALRKREAAAALRRLGVLRPPTFLEWPDAQPHVQGSAAFDGAVRKLSSICRQGRVNAVAVTAHNEPHCDHEAACRLAYAVASLCGGVSVFEYLVWANVPPGPSYECLRTPPIPPGKRHHALQAHRSQMTPLYGDGFRVPPRLQKRSATDLLFIRRPSA
jgi:N-acetylglucosamine malate deacetylase 1